MLVGESAEDAQFLGVTLVLLLACSNVGNLWVARAARGLSANVDRGIRMALGSRPASTPAPPCATSDTVLYFP